MSSSYIKRIFPALKKQIYGDLKETNVFTCQQLVVRTNELLELGDKYLLNSGKRARPAIIVTALLSGLSLLVENKKTRTVSMKKRIACTKKFKFDAFRALCPVHRNTFSYRYTEYIDLLFACLNKLPFIKDEKKYVHYHLADILTWFGKEDSPLSLTDEQYSIAIFKRGTAERKEREELILEAQEMIEKNHIPDNTKSKLYLVHKLLAEGCPTNDILNWTEGQLRIKAHSIDFRIETEDLNLDREVVDEEDMDDEEVAYYLE
jgi:hypothetical protein